MSPTKPKKKSYSGRNIRVSDETFGKLKLFVDQNDMKLGKYVERAIIEKLEKDKK